MAHQLFQTARSNVQDSERRRFSSIKPKSRLLTVQDIDSLPDMQWLVNDHLPKGGLCVLYGPSGAGKTFLALDLSLSVAIGRNWNACAVQRGSVVYVYCEGAYGLRQRIRAWRAHNLTSEVLDDIYFLTEEVSLLDRASVECFIQDIRSLKDTPVLIVLDTLARCLVGGDENSSQTMGLAIHHIDQIRKETGATVLVVHHTGKSNSSEVERGSSALRGAADAMLILQGPGERLILQCTKQKEAAPFRPTAWQLLTIQSAGSCVATSLGTSNPSPKLKREKLKPELNSNQLKVLETIKAAPSPGLIKAQIAKITKISPQTVDNVCEKLLALGLVVKGSGNLYTEHGPNDIKV